MKRIDSTWTVAARTVTCLAALAIASLMVNLAPAFGQGPGAAPNASAPDIAGVRTGMAIQDAYNVIKAVDPASPVVVGQVSVPALGNKPLPVLLQVGNDINASPDVVQASITLPPQKQVVWRIARQLIYDPGKELARATVVAALREKYGPESQAGPAEGTYIWLFDEQGRQVTGDRFRMNSFLECGAYFTAIGLSEEMPDRGVALSRYLQNLVTNVPEQRRCRLKGVVASLERSQASSVDVIRAVRVSIVDPPIGIASELATMGVIANAEAEGRRREREQAERQGKPNF